MGISVSYSFVLHLSFAPNGKFAFFSMFRIECFLHPPDEAQ